MSVATEIKDTAYLANWRKYSDRQRGQARAIAARRLLDFWEQIRCCRKWTAINQFYSAGDRNRSRWVRRQCYTLETAGLIELRQQPHAKSGLITAIRRRREQKA